MVLSGGKPTSDCNRACQHVKVFLLCLSFADFSFEYLLSRYYVKRSFVCQLRLLFDKIF